MPPPKRKTRRTASTPGPKPTVPPTDENLTRLCVWLPRSQHIALRVRVAQDDTSIEAFVRGLLEAAGVRPAK